MKFRPLTLEFSGVIFQKYVAIREAGRENLNDQQRKWLTCMRHIVEIKPHKGLVVVGDVSLLDQRARVVAIVRHKLFDECIMGVIIFNCCVMALTHRGEPSALTIFSMAANEICTCIFTGEAVLKIYGYGVEGYFHNNWNKFDFFVVVGSWLSLVMRILEMGGVNTAMFRIIQITKVIGRILRLFKLGNAMYAMCCTWRTLHDALTLNRAHEWVIRA